MNTNIASKLILPVAFFGYAIAANIAILPSAAFEPMTGKDVMQGKLTAQIDTLWREGLPGRDAATGGFGALRYAVLNDGRDGVHVGRDGWLFTDEEFRGQSGDATPTDLTLERVAVVHQRLATQGTRLIVVPLPAKVDILAEVAGAPEAAAARAADYNAFLDSLTTSGVEVVDTAPVFRQQGATAFLRTDTHWTPEMARLVARQIAANGNMPMGTTQFSVEEQAPEDIAGDLVSFVTSEEFAPQIGLTKERIGPYIAIADAAGAVSLFGDATQSIDTVLIGTSYSANPDWSFVEGLKLELGRDILNLAEQGNGPAQPMLTYLSEGAADLPQPPQYVIWEFPIRYLNDPGLWPEDLLEALDDV